MKETVKTIFYTIGGALIGFAYLGCLGYFYNEGVKDGHKDGYKDGYNKGLCVGAGLSTRFHKMKDILDEEEETE